MSSVHVLPWRYVHLAYVVLVAEFVDASMSLPAAHTAPSKWMSANKTQQKVPLDRSKWQLVSLVGKS